MQLNFDKFAHGCAMWRQPKIELCECAENSQGAAWQMSAVPQQTSKEKETQIYHRFVQAIGPYHGP